MHFDCTDLDLNKNKRKNYCQTENIKCQRSKSRGTPETSQRTPFGNHYLEVHKYIKLIYIKSSLCIRKASDPYKFIAVLHSEKMQENHLILNSN